MLNIHRIIPKSDNEKKFYIMEHMICASISTMAVVLSTSLWQEKSDASSIVLDSFVVLIDGVAAVVDISLVVHVAVYCFSGQNSAAVLPETEMV